MSRHWGCRSLPAPILSPHRSWLWAGHRQEEDERSWCSSLLPARRGPAHCVPAALICKYTLNQASDLRVNRFL